MVSRVGACITNALYVIEICANKIVRAVFFAGTKSICSVYNISNIVITITALPIDKDSFFVHPLRCCLLDLNDDDHV